MVAPVPVVVEAPGVPVVLPTPVVSVWLVTPGVVVAFGVVEPAAPVVVLGVL